MGTDVGTVSTLSKCILYETKRYSSLPRPPSLLLPLCRLPGNGHSLRLVGFTSLGPARMSIVSSRSTGLTLFHSTSSKTPHRMMQTNSNSSCGWSRMGTRVKVVWRGRSTSSASSFSHATLFPLHSPLPKPSPRPPPPSPISRPPPPSPISTPLPPSPFSTPHCPFYSHALPSQLFRVCNPLAHPSPSAAP